VYFTQVGALELCEASSYHSLIQTNGVQQTSTRISRTKEACLQCSTNCSDPNTIGNEMMNAFLNIRLKINHYLTITQFSLSESISRIN
jgi:hypothetical protein